MVKFKNTEKREKDYAVKKQQQDHHIKKRHLKQREAKAERGQRIK